MAEMYKNVLYMEFLACSELLRLKDSAGFTQVVVDGYMMTDWLCRDYPQHCAHFHTKDVPGIFTGEREIIVCYINSQPAGVIILKKTTLERKICTLYVKLEYRKGGVATGLLKRAFGWLGTTQPIITIMHKRLDDFAGIIARYGWQETFTCVHGDTGIVEHYYNGARVL